MFGIFNPLKTITGILSASLSLLVLGYTHSQAFKAGIHVNENPIAHVLATVMGIPIPEKSCSQQDRPWYDNLNPFGHSKRI